MKYLTVPLFAMMPLSLAYAGPLNIDNSNLADFKMSEKNLGAEPGAEYGTMEVWAYLKLKSGKVSNVDLGTYGEVTSGNVDENTVTTDTTMLDQSHSQKYAAGISDLHVGPSDATAKCAIIAAINGQSMTKAFNDCRAQFDIAIDEWGFDGSGSDVFAQPPRVYSITLTSL